MPIYTIPKSDTYPSLDGPIAVCPHSLGPRFWLTVWQIQRLAILAPNTQASKLRGADALYEDARKLFDSDCLDALLSHLDFAKLEMALDVRFAALNNHAIQHNSKISEAWNAAHEFIIESIKGLMPAAANDARLRTLNQRLRSLELKYAAFRVRQQKTTIPGLAARDPGGLPR